MCINYDCFVSETPLLLLSMWFINDNRIRCLMFLVRSRVQTIFDKKRNMDLRHTTFQGCSCSIEVEDAIL
jgi:hypothetical protein